MTVAPLPLSPEQELRALLESVLLDDGIIDTARPWILERLLASDTDAADLEHDDGESDQGVDGSAIVLDFVPPRRINSGGGPHAF